jgi:acetylornithine deacetylase/succinyl-diaminopimelate desuccinylase-like protein
VSISLSAEQSERLETLLNRLIESNSVNPWITPGAPGEHGAAMLLGNWLEAIPGVEVTLDEVVPGRPNVVARVKGEEDGRRLCCNVHTDTVGSLGWDDRAFVPRREGDRVVGLGAADNKGQCAALALAVERLAASPPPGEFIAVFAIDEEGPSIGTHHLVKTLVADGAVVLEPMGRGNVCVAHQGFGSLDLVVRAVAAHGLSDDAVDAGVQMAGLIDGLARIDRTVLAPNPHPLVGKAFFHTSWLRGGTDYGTYPAELTLGFEFGTVPGETLADRIGEIEALIAERRSSDPTLDAEVRIALENEPFEAAGHEELLATFSDATDEVIGRPATPIGFNTWTDAAIMQSAGIPTILVGGEGGGFHAIDEWVSLSSLADLALVLDGTARRFQLLASPV